MAEQFLADEEGKSALKLASLVAAAMIAILLMAMLAVTNGDPMGVSQRIRTGMYFNGLCTDGVPGACKVANLHWGL